MSRDDSGHTIREVSARRLSTADPARQAVEETVSVVLEAPVTIDVQGVESYTLLCTPDDNLALATASKAGVLEGGVPGAVRRGGR